MAVYAIVPVKTLTKAKSRLSTAFSNVQRTELASIMLEHTLSVLTDAKSISLTLVVSSDADVKKICSKFIACEFVQENSDAGVNAAVALGTSISIRERASGTIVVPQDLPLLESSELDSVINAGGTERIFVICPSQKFDGTNILYRKPPDLIDTSYDNNSYYNHLKAAKSLGIEHKIIFSEALAHDIDTIEDIKSLIELHPDETDNPVLDYLKSKFQVSKGSDPSPVQGQR